MVSDAFHGWSRRSTGLDGQTTDPPSPLRGFGGQATSRGRSGANARPAFARRTPGRARRGCRAEGGGIALRTAVAIPGRSPRRPGTPGRARTCDPRLRSFRERGNLRPQQPAAASALKGRSPLQAGRSKPLEAASDCPLIVSRAQPRGGCSLRPQRGCAARAWPSGEAAARAPETICDDGRGRRAERVAACHRTKSGGMAQCRAVATLDLYFPHSRWLSWPALASAFTRSANSSAEAGWGRSIARAIRNWRGREKQVLSALHRRGVYAVVVTCARQAAARADSA
jgi:hypothetical protein